MRLVAAIAATATRCGASAARAALPIEGTWNFNGGAVLVEATGPSTLKGTVTAVTQFASSRTRWARSCGR